MFLLFFDNSFNKGSLTNTKEENFKSDSLISLSKIAFIEIDN
jgi:hypothetical protein